MKKTITKQDTRIVAVDGKLSLSGKDRGFTIIELLVVMAIIGLLAAIAIPVFSKLKNNAYDSAAQSDLRQVALQAESNFTTTGAYPATTAVTPFVVTAATAPVLATPNVKLTNTTEVVQYTKGANSFVASIYDTRTNNVYCWNGATGGMSPVVSGGGAAAALTCMGTVS